MSKGIGVVGLYVHDQDEALDFYVNKLGFAVHTDAKNGTYRWLTVKHPDQPTFELGLFLPQEPVLDLTALARLDFSEPDLHAFPCLRLACEALEAGGTAPAPAQRPLMPSSGPRFVARGAGSASGEVQQ